MYARLNPALGWTWENEDGTRGFFILSDIERYAGMLAGMTPKGRACTRPMTEYDALSFDGIEWFPLAELKEQIPWERSSVRTTDVPLPD